jgi:hypothetical protein
MKPKAIATGALSAFVAVSMGYLIVKETRNPKPDTTEQGNDAVAAPEQVPVAGTAEKPSNAAESVRIVVAYYFYGNVRCQTCRKLEAYTSESVTTSFPNELADGRLQWKTANVDEKENEHFVKDYELTSRSVVLVYMVDGTQVEWKNLASIWDLVADKAAFQKYISDETAAFLKKGSM